MERGLPLASRLVGGNEDPGLSPMVVANSSLGNARPHLNLHWEVVWEPHIHFLVFEAWFAIAQSHLLGATNVYHMSLYVAHSQSYQLYQMTFVERQKFDEEEDDGCVE